MSRTTRKSCYGDKSRYLKEELSNPNLAYWKKVRKPKEQYKREYALAEEKALKEYNEQLKTALFDEFGRPYKFVYGYDYRTKEYGRVIKLYIYLNFYVTKYIIVRGFYTIEEYTKEIHKEYDKSCRDGFLKESNRKKSFRKEAARKTRAANKKFCYEAMKNSDDLLPLPNGHEGDYLTWCYWWFLFTHK